MQPKPARIWASNQKIQCHQSHLWGSETPKCEYRLTMAEWVMIIVGTIRTVWTQIEARFVLVVGVCCNFFRKICGMTVWSLPLRSPSLTKK